MDPATLRRELAPPCDLTFCPGYRVEHFMDIAGKGKAPGRRHVLAAAAHDRRAARQAADAIDVALAEINHGAVLACARDLPATRPSLDTVGAACERNIARLTEF